MSARDTVSCSMQGFKCQPHQLATSHASSPRRWRDVRHAHQPPQRAAPTTHKLQNSCTYDSQHRCGYCYALFLQWHVPDRVKMAEREWLTTRDPHCNVSESIAAKIGVNLHLQPHHPLHIIKTKIESYFSEQHQHEGYVCALRGSKKACGCS